MEISSNKFMTQTALVHGGGVGGNVPIHAFSMTHSPIQTQSYFKKKLKESRRKIHIFNNAKYIVFVYVWCMMIQ